MPRLEDQIKELIVRQLELKVSPEQIGDNDELFSSKGLGLDSIDSMAIIAGIDEAFDVAMTDDDLLKPDKIFKSVKTLTEFVKSKQI